MITLQGLVSKASQINRRVEKEVKSFAKTCEGKFTEEHCKILEEKWKATKLKGEINRYRDDIMMALELKTMLQQMEEETGEQLLFMPQGQKQSYFITVRPDTTKVKFTDFYNDVRKFVERKCFIAYKLSFEQKGTTTENLGEGFHVHIVAEMRQRSKGEVLRDTQNTFKGYTAGNCIEVLTTKNPAELVENYLVNYQSDDGHKAPTKEGDAAWRARENLQNLYSNPEGLPIKSILATPKTVPIRVTF